MYNINKINIKIKDIDANQTMNYYQDKLMENTYIKAMYNSVTIDNIYVIFLHKSFLTNDCQELP